MVRVEPLQNVLALHTLVSRLCQIGKFAKTGARNCAPGARCVFNAPTCGEGVASATEPAPLARPPAPVLALDNIRTLVWLLYRWLSRCASHGRLFKKLVDKTKNGLGKVRRSLTPNKDRAVDESEVRPIFLELVKIT